MDKTDREVKTPSRHTVQRKLRSDINQTLGDQPVIWLCNILCKQIHFEDRIKEITFLENLANCTQLPPYQIAFLGPRKVHFWKFRYSSISDFH